MSQEKFFNYAELEFIRAHESVEGSADQSDSGVANRVSAQLGKNSVWLKERMELLDTPKNIYKLSTPSTLEADKSYMLMSEGEYKLPDLMVAAGTIVNVRASASGVKVTTTLEFANRTKEFNLMKGTTLSLIMNEDCTAWHNVRSSIDGISYTIDEVDVKFTTKEEIGAMYAELLKRVATKVDKTDFNTTVENLNLGISARQTIDDANAESERVDVELSKKYDKKSAEDETRRVNEELNKKQSVVDASAMKEELLDRIHSKADAEETSNRLDSISAVANAAQTKSDASLEKARVDNELSKKVNNADYELRNQAVDKALSAKVEVESYNTDMQKVNSDISDRQTKAEAATETARVDDELRKKVDKTEFNARSTHVDEELGLRVLKSDQEVRDQEVDRQLNLRETCENADLRYKELKDEIATKGGSEEIGIELDKKANKAEVWSRIESDLRFIKAETYNDENLSSESKWYTIGTFSSRSTARMLFEGSTADSYHNVEFNISLSSISVLSCERFNRNLLLALRIVNNVDGTYELSMRVGPRTNFSITSKLITGMDFKPTRPVVNDSVEAPSFYYELSETEGIASTRAAFSKVLLGEVELNKSPSGISLSLLHTDLNFLELSDRSSNHYNSEGELKSSIGIDGVYSYSGDHYTRISTGSDRSNFNTTHSLFEFNKSILVPSLRTSSGIVLNELGSVITPAGKLGLESGSPDADFTLKSLNLYSGNYVISQEADHVRLTSKMKTSFFFSGDTESEILSYDSTSVDSKVQLKENGHRVFSRGNKVTWSDQDIEGRPEILKGTTGKYGSIQVDVAKGGYSGYSINGRYSFLGDDAGNYGLFDELKDSWLISNSSLGFKLYHRKSPVLSSQDDGLIVQSDNGADSFRFTVNELGVLFKTTTLGYNFEKKVSATSFISGMTYISGSGVFDNGERVYSPQNKPTPEDLGSLSTETFDNCLLAVGRMNTWSISSGKVTSLPEGDWWRIGSLEPGCSIKLNAMLECTEGANIPTRKISMEVTGSGKVNGTMECAGDMGSLSGFYILNEGDVIRVWMRLPANYSCLLTTHCLGDTTKWNPDVLRTDTTPSSETPIIDTTQVPVEGIYRLSTGIVSKVFDSNNLPEPYEIHAAKKAGDIDQDFEAKNLNLRSYSVLGQGSQLMKVETTLGKILQTYENVSSEILIGSSNSYKFSSLDSSGFFEISPSSVVSRVPLMVEEDGVLYGVYSTLNKSTEIKLRNYESSGFDFNQNTFMFNSKSLVSTDGAVIKFNDDSAFTSLSMKGLLLMDGGLGLTENSVFKVGESNFLEVLSSGDIRLGAAGGTLRLGNSNQNSNQTLAIVVESTIKDVNNKVLVTPDGEIRDKGSRVYSPNNKPTPSDIGAANLQGDVAVDFSADNLNAQKVTSNEVESSVLRIGSIELRQNPDGSLGFYI